MKIVRQNKVIWVAGVLLAMFALSGCAALRGEVGMQHARDYDPSVDGYNYYDEMDDYYYEYMGY